MSPVTVSPSLGQSCWKEPPAFYQTPERFTRICQQRSDFLPEAVLRSETFLGSGCTRPWTLLPYPHSGAVLSPDLLTLRSTQPFLCSVPYCPGDREMGPAGGSSQASTGELWAGGREEPGTSSLSLFVPAVSAAAATRPCLQLSPDKCAGVQGLPEHLCHGSSFYLMTPTLSCRRQQTLLCLPSLRVAVSSKYCCVAAPSLVWLPCSSILSFLH